MTGIKGTSKLFKSGNSFGLRLTKKDKEILQATSGEEFEKVISPDGQSITFHKKSQVSNETLKTINRLFDENKELMERLKDE